MIKVGDVILFTNMTSHIFIVDRISDRYIDYICPVEKVRGNCTVEYFKTFGIKLVLSPLMLELL